MKGRRFKKIGGSHIGARAKRVKVCEGCGCHESPLRPGQCLQCGGLAFINFDSGAEAGRWHQLLMLQDRGEISGLRRQVSFDLLAARELDGRTVPAKVVRYVADFVYERGGERVIEDVKPRDVMSDVADLKLKWMAAMGLKVTITSKAA